MLISHPITLVIILVASNILCLLGMVIAFKIVRDLININEFMIDSSVKQTESMENYVKIMEKEMTIIRAINSTNIKILDLYVKSSNGEYDNGNDSTTTDGDGKLSDQKSSS